jgi:hypothetical protein
MPDIIDKIAILERRTSALREVMSIVKRMDE